MKTFTILATEETTKRLHRSLIQSLANTAYEKFQEGERSGKFNRFNLFAGHFIVYFENENSATVMTYGEALQMPVLGEKCKEMWGNSNAEAES